jgi:hypothetical protein
MSYRVSNVPSSVLLVILFLAVQLRICGADTISLTGTLLNPEDTALIDFTLGAPGTVTLQTYGFGGGINAAAMTIPAGGFDPFVALFSDAGVGAILVNGTSDVLSNYSSGCPPAGTVTIGSVSGQCGDVDLVFAALPAGAYTILLSDGEYLPNAVFEVSPAFLADGFTDLTGGVFQTCYDTANCNADTANWALDITAPSGTFSPEPASMMLAGLGVCLVYGCSAEGFQRKEIHRITMQLHKFSFSLAGLLVAVGVLTLAVPRAAPAVAAALVQITDTAAITQAVGEQASQLIQLNCVATTCTLAGNLLVISRPYTVPADKSLVITAVDLLSINTATPIEPCRSDHPVGVSGAGSLPIGFDQYLTWEILAGSPTLHFVYPSGIVFHGNDTVAFVNNPYAPTTIRLQAAPIRGLCSGI